MPGNQKLTKVIASGFRLWSGAVSLGFWRGRASPVYACLGSLSWQCDDSSLLRITPVSRSFPGVQALGNAGLEVLRDEIHALFGENGAGKSTLIKYPFRRPATR